MHNSSCKHSVPLFPLVMVLLSGITWGVISIFVRTLASHGVTTLQIATLRVAGAALIMGIFLLLFKRSAFCIRCRDLWCFIGTGVVSIVCFNFCYFAAMQRISVGLAAILLYTSPAFVAILSRFCFKEPFTILKTVVTAMIMAGCILVSGIGRNCAADSTGIILGLCSGLCYSLFSIFGRYAQNRGYDAITISFWSFLMGTLALSPFMPWTACMGIFKASPVLTPYLAGLVIISTILPYVLYTLGMRMMEVSKAAAIVAIEPITCTLTGIIFFGERLSFPIIAGITLVISAIILLSKEKS